jgi:hypothetical protein
MPNYFEKIIDYVIASGVAFMPPNLVMGSLAQA